MATPLFRAKAFAAAASLLVLNACTVGPDFKPATAPADAGYTSPALPKAAGGDDAGPKQHLALDMAIPVQWWGLFHSQPLNDLVAEALRHNPTIDAAAAALRQANEVTASQVSAYYPVVSGTLNSTREKDAAILSSPTTSTSAYYTLHTAELTVGYTPDVFGANHRQVESLAADAENQYFQLQASRLTLASNVVVAAIAEASLRAQIEATERLISSQRTILESFRRQLALGQVAEADVMSQETQLAQNEAALPPLAKQLAQQRNALAALLGRLPNAEIPQKLTLADLTLPDTLPVSLPSKLVEQRPDVRAAQAQMHAAEALIGVAIAGRLPDIELTAGLGRQAGTLAGLFQPGATLWNVGGNLTQTLFDFDGLYHKQKAAEAGYEQAEATYRATVITAFQNVADSLQAIAADADAQRSAQRAERLAARSLEMNRKQLVLGNVTALAVIAAEQAWLQTSLTLIAAQADRLSDSAALIQALGGGWWNLPEGQ